MACVSTVHKCGIWSYQ